MNDELSQWELEQLKQLPIKHQQFASAILSGDQQCY